MTPDKGASGQGKCTLKTEVKLAAVAAAASQPVDQCGAYERNVQQEWRWLSGGLPALLIHTQVHSGIAAFADRDSSLNSICIEAASSREGQAGDAEQATQKCARKEWVWFQDQMLQRASGQWTHNTNQDFRRASQKLCGFACTERCFFVN